ncbi:hypothetical protein AB4P95_30175 (plasmid) [Pseudomonas sp. A1437]|uniref:hypothetical protein n=1 Tax=Pseudomonas sp. A1437 TaxID=3235107 RepID=UPI0037837E93
MSEANKHVMDCVDLDDGGSRRCLGCRQFVHGNLTETPPGECPTPYKSPKQLLDEALAREAALREELAELREELSEEFDDEERKTETLQEAIAWIKKDRADYKSQWLSASESLKLQGITIRVGADREAALRVQLNDATTSLETISKHQGEPVGFLHKHFREAQDVQLGAIAWVEEGLFCIPAYLGAPMQAAEAESEREQGIPGTSFQRLNQLANEGE